MCGINGLISTEHSKETSYTFVQRMNDLIKHRGPDDDGLFIEKNVGLGFVRLSIINLSIAGHQPKLSADNRYVIVFNGEIFNSR